MGSRHSSAQSQALAPAPSFRLEESAAFPHQATGVACSAEGRIFVNFPRWTEDVPVSVAEVQKDGSLRPYPDEEWNTWRNAPAVPGAIKPHDHFVCVQSVVCDSRGNLWVLDAAAPNLEKVVTGGAKLVRISLSTNKVEQVIKFGEDIALQGSYLNDVRFMPDGRTAFITDSGARGSILVVDLEKGTAHSRLDGHPSTQPDKGVEVTVEGRKLQRPDGRGLQVAVDGLALSNDGKTLYFQPLTGRLLYRIAPSHLMSDDPEVAGQKVEKAGSSCVADGLLMTRDDRLLITSPEDSSIKLWEGDRARTLVQDPNLRWPDSMAEMPDGSILVTASRIQDSAWFNKDAPQALPTKLYRLAKT
ncbi:MAG TPA: L-dopachrome tautomerase-related protein [Reyranella sp.]|nr:L-dopachrome tautomerase-related protein [Reyranella sp.]